jgi:hypothetical protein
MWVPFVALAIGLVAVIVVLAQVVDLTGGDGTGGQQAATPAATTAPATTVPPEVEPVAPPLGEQSGLRLYGVAPGLLVETDLDTGLLRRTPLDAQTEGVTGRSVVASLGQLFVWPVGNESGLARVPLTRGGPGAARPVVDRVETIAPGWALGSLVARISARVGELNADGFFQWGPSVPPASEDGELVGGLERQAVLAGERVVAWGPSDGSTGTELVPPDGELVAVGPDGVIWLDPAGALHLPSVGGELVLPASASPGGWLISGAAVSPSGHLALSVEPAPGQQAAVVVIARDGSITRYDGPPLAEVAADQSAAADAADQAAAAGSGGPYTLVRWSPDSRWIFIANSDLTDVVAVRRDAGTPIALPGFDIEGISDFAVMRVSSR